nr:hypothetical protein [Tanacetum cinerariifolium]
MELYMMNRQHGNMILESVKQGLHIWPTIKENGVTQPKKYSELTTSEAIQADCDVKATNIILQGGNLLSKTTREALQIIKNKSKVRYSRNKPNVSRMNTTSRENASKSDDRIDKLADQISTLVDIFDKKVVTPAPIKAVEESYVTCGGAHA